MYKITIAKEERVTITKDEYEKIADTGNERDNGAVYGYVPRVQDVDRTTTVLAQAVDELDLAKVIKVINNID